MRLSLKARQVAAVTSIVGLAVTILGGLYVSGVARVRLEESRARGQFLANAIYHRTREAAAAGGDPYAALRADPGLRSILESSAYSPNVTYAAIVDAGDVVIAHSDATQVGQRLADRPSLDSLLQQPPWQQLRALYAGQGQTLEIQQPLLMGDTRFGTIRIGVSMVLTRADLDRALRPAIITALAALVAASLLAMLLAQSLLRPIHLIRGGLSRLGRGEFGVTLDLPRDDELGELGGFFNDARVGRRPPRRCDRVLHARRRVAVRQPRDDAQAPRRARRAHPRRPVGGRPPVPGPGRAHLRRRPVPGPGADRARR
jgi:hypothetical protein